MLDTLVASRAARLGARTWASTAFVALLHATVIAAAIWATRRESVAQSPPIIIGPDDWPEWPSAPRDPPPGTPGIFPNPEVGLFGPLPLPDLPEHDIGTTVGAPVVPMPAATPEGIGWPGADGAAVLAALVEERPELLSAPVPVYPETLRRLGVAGRVTVDVVVDTLGRVERGSFTVVQTPHPGLVDPVRQALGRALFRPARVHGRAVRVLVRIPFEFRIAR